MESRSTTIKPQVNLDDVVTPPSFVTDSSFKSANSKSISGDESSFLNLPDELTITVFSYLRPAELLSSVSRVCKHWHTLCTDPRLLRDLKFELNSPSTSGVIKVIKMASWLTHLELDHRSDTNEILSHLGGLLGKNKRNLKTLNIRSCQGASKKKRVSSACLLSVLKLCPELSNLSLQGTKCSDGTVFQEMGHTLPSLTCIDLGRSDEFTSGALMSIAERPSTIPLTSMSMDGLQFDESDFEDIYYFEFSFAEFCNRFHESLTVVDLGSFQVSDENLKALSTCHKLTKVEFWYSESLTNEGIMSLSGMPNLHTLTLWQVLEVTALEWIRFFDMPHIKKIRSLCLDMCENVDDNVACVVAQNLRNLESFSVYNCINITPEGHARVQQFLQGHCKYMYSK